MTNNQFQESLIPKFVWDFVKKVIKNPITAGILALIIWNYIKNKDLKKGVKKESVEDFFTEEEFNNLIDSLYSEDNTMDNSGDVLTTVIPNDKKEGQQSLGNYSQNDFVRKGNKIVSKISSVKDSNEYSFILDGEKVVKGELNGKALPDSSLKAYEKDFKKMGLIKREVKK